MLERWRSVGAVTLTLLCLLGVIYPLFAGVGPVNTRGGGDSPFLLVRLEQMVADLRAGGWPARWMPDAAYGLGYPFFNFYAALPYYIAAALRLSGWGAILSLQATQALGFVLAAAAMALLARRIFVHPAAVVLSVVAYTCMPFHLVNVYVRGDSLSEFYAFVFYPLIFWSMLRLYDAPSLPRLAVLALSYGGLILTHNLSAILFSPFVAAWGLLLVRQVWRAHGHRPAGRCLVFLLGGGLLGLLLSATLWLSILGDVGGVWMGVKDIQTSGFFHYAAHLRPLSRLIQPALWFNYAIEGDNTPFAMGLAQSLAILVGLVALIGGWLRRRLSAPGRADWGVFGVMALLVCTWMLTTLSRPLWDHLPLLPVVQFPWRLLSVQGFFAALIIGAVARGQPKSWWVAVLLAIFLTGAAVGGLQPEYLPIGESDVTPQRLAWFELLTANVGTTIRGEYLPAGVEPGYVSSAVMLNRGEKPAPMVLEGQLAQAVLMQRDARQEQWGVRVESASARLAFYTLYFPGWQADIDGRPATLVALPNSGLIALAVPQGEHRVRLRLGRTPLRWLADGLSAGGLLAVLGLLGVRLRRVERATWRRAAVWGAAVLVGGGLVLGGGRMLAARPSPWADDLSADMDRAPFFHHNPQGIRFGEQAVLRSYSMSETVRGGETLTVQLSWAQAAAHLQADLRLVSPADAHPRFDPPPPPLAQAQAHLDGSTTVLTLTVPGDAASGLYLVSLRVWDGQDEVRPVNERGQGLGVTYLRPLWVDNPRPARPDDPILVRLGDQILLRDDVRVSAQDGYWDVRLTWQATAAIPYNYTCSVRVLAADGRLLAQRDWAEGPGYGFWPTTAWPVGQWWTDRLRVAAPSGVQVKDAAAISVVLYDRSQAGFPAVGSVMIPLVEREHVYERPAMMQAIEAVFGEAISLLGYDLERSDAALALTLHWQAVQRGMADDVVFVHLFDPQTETIVAQVDSRPLNGAYPTMWWRAGEVVSDRLVLSLTGVPAGNYALAVGLYDSHSLIRLPVRAAEQSVPDGRLLLTDTISVSR